jgi:hypothetical protein
VIANIGQGEALARPTFGHQAGATPRPAADVDLNPSTPRENSASQGKMARQRGTAQGGVYRYRPPKNLSAHGRLTGNLGVLWGCSSPTLTPDSRQPCDISMPEGLANL